MVCLAPTNPCLADIDPNSGIDFVTITHPGNPAWPGNGHTDDDAVGRGSVGYEYSIGRFEVTTAQWVEFFNAAFDRPAEDRIPHLAPPTFWGAGATQPNTPGGLRWTVPASRAMYPVGNISWRMAAIYCNWLHNGKSTDRSAFMSGAYDVGTFGFFAGIFTDQLEHSPGARYWIPTWDEWLKAAHWDPSRNDSDLGGWWEYSNGTDTPLVGAPPGVPEAQANFGWSSLDYPGQSPFNIPLGAYPQTQSPWGLIDVAGGTGEWTESVWTSNEGTRYRIWDGSEWNSFPGSAGLDSVAGRASEFPHLPPHNFGLRIASSVPSPSGCVLGVGVFAITGCARRRRR